MATATDVLHAMQAIEAVRSSRDPSLTATKLPTKLTNEFYSADDFQIEFKNEPINPSS